MRKKLWLRAAALLLSLLLLQTGTAAVNVRFRDTGGHWAQHYIEDAAVAGLVAGTSATTFSPDEVLTRAMFVTMLWRIAGTPQGAACGFTDTVPGSWYYEAVCWAVGQRVVAGVSQTRFAPEQQATREQICMMLAQFIDIWQQPPEVLPNEPSFADGADISSWAQLAVTRLWRAGLVSGTGGNCFSPQKPMTRAEAATLLVRYMSAVGALHSTRNLVNPAQVISTAQMQTDLQELAAAYPTLLTLSNAGTSFEGQELPLVRFGHGKRLLLLCGAVHAREYVSVNYLLEMLDEYAFAYENGGSYDGYDLHKLLNEFTLVLLPCVNPDGVRIAQGGFAASAHGETLRSMIGAAKGAALWKANAQGIDLNRNFPVGWPNTDDTHYYSPAYAYFGGYAAADAPETQAVLRVLRENSFAAVLDIHLAGNALYYADKGISGTLLSRSRALAQALAKVSGYTLQSVQSTSPGLANYARDTYQIPALTVELFPSTAFPTDTASFYNKIWLKAQDFPLIVMTFLSEGK